MNIKGYSKIIIVIFLISFSPICINFILNYHNPEMASVIWSVGGSLTSLIYFYFKKEKNDLKKIKKNIGTLSFMGCLAGIAVLLWFYSIDLIGPSLTAFIGRIGTIILIFLSIVFLKEKYNIGEGIGAFISLIGVGIITFSPIDYLGWKVIFIVLASTGYSINQIIIKKKVNKISPLILTTFLMSSVAVFQITYALITSKFEIPHINTLPIALVAPFFCELLAGILIIKSYKELDVSKTQVIRSSYPFIVILYSYILFKEILLPHQILGGIAIIGGVIVLIISKTKIKS